ncbi:UDP-N-acetylglucosamine acyltransferase, acyl-[acyl carrier protein]-UDP-N-acetylglucosamine-O-acyltransferase [Legionella beliardensis]|uniref:UDP-N-acetylglucosamine acyltransferase, acyl-[acyl carrier protein]-UDP-N-acetylglucosamine-O-acyltransferase n=1 Tax=Legionella beliardensis TaxID=91822 RepID=A0A378I3Q1_9GAMM|nr:acyl-ACP--UDP-N-acetylglucosamine O-acyltransferase [Legionella beliardensis]STX29326.1 UDP-N-acetylglucosamine acyltransferase, acyl-[acyl carrier protein]-UDP-N-acetylglucosamine-O-acyltransferase [Legionella beliardensis]
MKHDKNDKTQIHPTAIVSPKAKLGVNVYIGPYSVIGPHVKIGDHVSLHNHVTINGYTTIGDYTIVYPFACLGDPPQDLAYNGERSKLIIGMHNKIGHYVTMNGGTQSGGLITQIGNYGIFMDGSHVAHDCKVGDYVVIPNHVLLAGHVKVGNNVVFGGASSVVQNTIIGQGAFVTAHTLVSENVIPYGIVSGFRAKLRGLNIIGMKRLCIPNRDIHVVRQTYKILFDKSNKDLWKESVKKIKTEFPDNPYVQEIVDFIEQPTKKAFCTPYSAEDEA